MSEEGSGRRFRFDFSKLSSEAVYHNLSWGDMKKWISARKYRVCGAVFIAASFLVGYCFLPSQADLFQAEQEKRVLGEQLSRARADSIKKAREAKLLVEGFERDTSEFRAGYRAQVRSLEGKTEEKVAAAVRTTEHRQLEKEIGQLQREIAGILLQHPYLRRMSFTKGFYDLDNNGSNESVEYASSPGERALSGRSADDLAKVLEQIKTSQATYNELEASLTNLPSQDRKEIMGQFSRDRVKVFFDGTGNQIGVENLDSGNKKTYSVATMSVGGQR